MTHLDFISAKEALPRLASLLNPLHKGFSFILRQECVRPLASARGDKKERLGVTRREKEKFNNKIKTGGSLRVCSRT
jgi:hypothetical protein